MKNILLIGLGRFGKHIAIQSSQLGHEIMAVDLDEERVNDALPYVTNAQIGDSTNEEFLKSLGIANYDICFVTIGGSFQNSRPPNWWNTNARRSALSGRIQPAIWFRI